jgi:hypothetical protein
MLRCFLNREEMIGFCEKRNPQELFGLLLGVTVGVILKKGKIYVTVTRQ